MFHSIFDVVGEYPIVDSKNYSMEVIPSRTENMVYVRILRFQGIVSESLTVEDSEEVLSGLYEMIQQQIPGANLDESLAVLFLYAKFMRTYNDRDFVLTPTARERIRREASDYEA